MIKGYLDKFKMGGLYMNKLKINKKDLLQTVFIMIGVLVINIFIIGNSKVYGLSMYPTLNKGKHNDRVIVERYKHFTKNYKRGDIIILNSHEKEDSKYIKRIIGLPNETVEIKEGKIYINGDLLQENYISDDIVTNPEIEVKVPANHVFVLGDNREYSKDSREIGCISFDDIIGKATYKFNILDLSFQKLK